MGIIDWAKGLGGKTIYFSGCLGSTTSEEEFNNYKEIFKKLGVNFSLLEGEVPCGILALNAGYRKEAKKMINKNFEVFEKNSVKKIITSCPSCYYAFKNLYSQNVRNWNIEVEHVIITILNALKRKDIRFEGHENEREIVTYNDTCYLGRYSGIYDEPRELIERLGGRIAEMKLNREKTFCCGGEIVFRNSFPEFSRKIARKRVGQIPRSASRIISPCGFCHRALKEETEKSNELSTFVLGKIRGILR